MVRDSRLHIPHPPARLGDKPEFGYRATTLFFIVISGLAAGCAALGPAEHEFYLAELGGNPDPTKAYLIVSSNFVPSDREQPTWIAILKSTGAPSWVRPGDREFAHLSTSEYIFEFDPGKWRVVHVDFEEDPKLGRYSTIFLPTATPEIEMKAGTIDYYGRLEVGHNMRRTSVRTVRDLGLYGRACAKAPELFRQFEVVPVGPLARYGEVFPPCSEASGTEGVLR